MTAAEPTKRRSRRRPSFELTINGSMTHVPSASSSDSDSILEQDSPLLHKDLNTTAAAAAGKAGSPSKQQQKHVCNLEQERHQHISAQEWGNMALLVLLYAMQGIPLGLTMGAMPFLLQSKLSMTQMGLFSMSGYPYSFKLLWSPIVDSVYSAAFGRRKSWIVPVQLMSAGLLMFSADWIQMQFDLGAVVPLTVLFFCFVLLAATQDIAVDGWALTLLPPHHIEYASTCQTLGMNTGYFMSFTIFLALSSTEFCNQYIRSNRLLAGVLGLQPVDYPLITLRGYIIFWGCAFTLITLAIALWKQESDHYTEAQERKRQRRRKHKHKHTNGSGSKVAKLEAGTAGAGDEAVCSAVGSEEEGDLGLDWSHRKAEIVSAYARLWEVVCLPAIWALSFLLVTYRLGVLPAESAASLKLLDKGVAKEALAALVLVQFPVELVSAVIAGRWASTHSPYQPFMAGYVVRIVMAVLLTTLAQAFPPGASSFLEHRYWFGMLSAIGLVTSFSSTLMFTALGSFFNRVSDPGMGGAYLTLLNTIANMGVILPKTPLFAAMDWLTFSQCHDKDGHLVPALSCPKKLRLLAGSSPCTDAGNTCSMGADGFYVVSYSMVVLGVVLGFVYIKLFPRLISLPLHQWRAKHA